jgi:hypothetical protein
MEQGNTREEVKTTGSTAAATTLKSGGWPRLFLPDLALWISKGDCAMWTWFSLQEEQRPLGRLQRL